MLQSMNNIHCRQIVPKANSSNDSMSKDAIIDRNDSADSSNDVTTSNDAMHMPLHFSNQLESTTENRNAPMQKESMAKKESFMKQSDHCRSIGENDIEKENVPMQQMSSLSFVKQDNRERKSRRLQSRTCLDAPNEPRRSLRKSRFKVNDAMEMNDNAIDDREIMELLCDEEHEVRCMSSISNSGRVNPAIPTLDIINYPPDFDIFNHHKVIFRPIRDNGD